MLADGGGHQLVYYEDFHDSSEGGHEHFLDRYCPDTNDDPLQALLNGDFREAVIDAIDRLAASAKKS